MSNFFNDNPSLKHYLSHPLMRKIMALKERSYTEKDRYEEAPLDYDDAIDSFERVLDVVGELSGEVFAPNASEIDKEGPCCQEGRVTYARAMEQNLDLCRKAGLMGISVPRRYGGLNFPTTVFAMAAEIVSRSDAGFENVWGLQECAEILYEFGSEEQRQRYIPSVCAGATMAMALTEPDAGSDLQAVMLKATFDEENNTWRLNGVKRFITNGDADIHLVLARSEPGTSDGRGLSMFIYEKKNGGLRVRRIENKMGIKGSPTCELVFKDAPAELCGSRRLGLIKYVMALMNGARLGIASQSVGLSEAAYREAVEYARTRKQFGKCIMEMPAVTELLETIQAKLCASRSLLYETSRYVDMAKVLEDIARERLLNPEEKLEQKKYARWADAYTPMAKGMSSEYANQNAYDAIQVHGGSGFMKDYACERIYRDARITSIYEGTTQLQVVAAIRHVTTGTYSEKIREYAQVSIEKPHLMPLAEELRSMAADYEKLLADTISTPALERYARRLVETAAHIVMGYLLLFDADALDALEAPARNYIYYGKAEIAKHVAYCRACEG